LKSFVLAAIGEEVSTFAIEKAPSRAISITVLLIANQSRQRPGCRLVRSSNHLRLRLIEEQAVSNTETYRAVRANTVARAADCVR
jgi:hypothetical protein